jgi:hypothetical protein
MINHEASRDDILSYREMCEQEGVQTLQRGMNYRLNDRYSVVLMSQRPNAPYHDRVYEDGITIEYEGHDAPKKSYDHDPKKEDQPARYWTGSLTQNGRFVEAVEGLKRGAHKAEPVKVYEKILPGVWSLKGMFELVDYRQVHDGYRNVYKFIMKLAEDQEVNKVSERFDTSPTRIIPTHIKKAVWERDRGKCVKCGSAQDLHFDHELPFSKGGTSLSAKNIRLLCMKHNLEKSSKIE